MNRIHINPSQGVAKPCKAEKGNCPFGEENHYDSFEEARASYESEMTNSTIPRELKKYEDLESSYQMINDADEAEALFYSKYKLSNKTTQELNAKTDELFAALEKRGSRRFTLSGEDEKIYNFIKKRVINADYKRNEQDLRDKIKGLERAYEDIAFGYKVRNKFNKKQIKASSTMMLLKETIESFPDEARMRYDRPRRRGYIQKLSGLE